MEKDQPFHSICHVRALELFPKPVLEYSEAGVKMPYIPLCGEAVQAIGATDNGVIVISNFRLFISLDEKTYYNIPLGTIDCAEVRDYCIVVFCKDCKSIRCNFDNNERAQEWLKRLQRYLLNSRQCENQFAFAFYAWAVEEANPKILSVLKPKRLDYYNSEITRMGFNLDVWRVSRINSEFKLCPSYPPLILVPANVSDDSLEAISNFRISRRFPAVVWRHSANGAVIARSSQPEVGLLHWRSQEDELLIESIRRACELDSPSSRNEDDRTKKVLIIDARSFSTAFVNRARGGGVECSDYYPRCHIEFMCLPNIHTVRKSFHSLRTLFGATELVKWLSSLEATNWLQYMADLLKAAIIVVDAVDTKGWPVLVHCSDGWDRTPQIVSLAQIMLDPYYRTVEGFQVLVQREWLDFGHKFADRCSSSSDFQEHCPIFLQFLDCVHQILVKFPCSFEFTELFLVKLAQHIYSNLFGTFMGNSSVERAELNITDRTFCVWSILNDPKYKNVLYVGYQGILRPESSLKDIIPWTTVYMPASNVLNASAKILNDEIRISNGDSHEEVELDLANLEISANGTQRYIKESLPVQHTTMQNGENKRETDEKVPISKSTTNSTSQCDRTKQSPMKLDIDGFLMTVDPSQKRVRELLDEKRIREESLQRNLEEALETIANLRMRLNSQETNGYQDNNSDSQQGSIAVPFDMSCVETVSLPSDDSWETVGDNLEISQWIRCQDPSQCTNCLCSLASPHRRHQCRMCKKVFCANCAETTAVAPSGYSLDQGCGICCSQCNGIEDEHEPSSEEI